jgi:anthranilate phosphoribosyltransferase
VAATLPTLIHAIGAGAKRARNLTREEALDVARAVVTGAAEPVQIGAILISFRVKGETAEELAAFAQALAEGTLPHAAAALATLGMAQGAPPGLDVDVHGDGHEGRPSTALAAACVAVAAGARVLLRTHLGSRHSHAGLGRIAETMGIGPARDAAHAVATMAGGAPALLDVEAYHPRLGWLLSLRDSLGVRSAIHTAAKLLDPAGFGSHLIGIFHAPFHDPVAGALGLLGSKRGLIVRAPGGLPEPAPDKLTPCGIQAAGQTPRLVDVPGLAMHNAASRDGGGLPHIQSLDDAALLALDALERNVGGPLRHAILVGAATMLVAAGLEPDFEPAAMRARAVLDRGAARRVLARWREFSSR